MIGSPRSSRRKRSSNSPRHSHCHWRTQGGSPWSRSADAISGLRANRSRWGAGQITPDPSESSPDRALRHALRRLRRRRAGGGPRVRATLSRPGYRLGFPPTPQRRLQIPARTPEGARVESAQPIQRMTRLFGQAEHRRVADDIVRWPADPPRLGVTEDEELSQDRPTAVRKIARTLYREKGLLGTGRGLVADRLESSALLVHPRQAPEIGQSGIEHHPQRV